MSENPQDGATEQPAEYQDFITFKPEPVKFITKKEYDLIYQHILILRALRNKHMSVKEMYNLYYYADTKSYAYTIKTIYKHLEKLEKANLVKVSGHRMTQGSRQTEKLYSRSANIFVSRPEEKKIENNIDRIKIFSEFHNIIMSELLQVPRVEKNDSFDFFRQLYELMYQTDIEILENTKTNKSIADITTQIDLDKLNIISESTCLLMVFLRHPHLFEQLQRLYKSV
jgi:Fe2+ or Zn2+ uptake regulation protein